MSFICQKCGTQQGDRVKPFKQVTEKRFVKYPEVEKRGKKYIPEGYEIVKELNVCESCYEKSKDDEIKVIGYKVVEGTFRDNSYYKEFQEEKLEMV